MTHLESWPQVLTNPGGLGVTSVVAKSETYLGASIPAHAVEGEVWYVAIYGLILCGEAPHGQALASVGLQELDVVVCPQLVVLG